MINHADKACELFSQGKNCSQAVMAAFCDVTDMDEEIALKLSSSFGGGMGRMREVCGACTGMFMVAGILYGYSDCDDYNQKTEHYKRIQMLAEEFKSVYGTIKCSELLKNLNTDSSPVPDKRTEQYYKVRPCVRFVRTAAEILDRYINDNPIEKT